MKFLPKAVRFGLAGLALTCGLFAASTPAQRTVKRTAQAKKVVSSPQAPAVTLTAPTLFRGRGFTFNVSIALTDSTNAGVASYQFTLTYDPAIINPVGGNAGCSNVGTLAPANHLVTCNVDPTPGTLYVSDFGSSATSGSGTLLNIAFQVTNTAPIAGVSPLTLTDVEVNQLGGPLDPTAIPGSVTVLAPTAANVSVSGRVLTSTGSTVAGARVTIADAQAGTSRTAITNSFGYFSFDEVASGNNYILSTTAKRLSFASQLLQVTDTITGVEIIAR
jgi:hypothetical protein